MSGKPQLEMNLLRDRKGNEKSFQVVSDTGDRERWVCGLWNGQSPW